MEMTGDVSVSEMSMLNLQQFIYYSLSVLFLVLGLTKQKPLADCDSVFLFVSPKLWGKKFALTSILLWT